MVKCCACCFCCKSTQDKPELEDCLRQDKVGRRRLSVMSLGPVASKVQDTRDMTSAQTVSHEAKGLKIFGQSLPGTYGTDAFKQSQEQLLLLSELGGATVIGVLDGHGINGHMASDLLKTGISTHLQRQQAKLVSATEATLQSVFKKAQAESLKRSKATLMCSGTTCNLCVFRGNTVICANVGDSRAVLCYKSPNGKIKHKDLSKDHKPSNQSERERVQQAGGRISTNPNAPKDEAGPERVWHNTFDYPGLDMTRCLGNYIAMRVGCSSEPEFVSHTFNEETDLFVVVASDGIWQVLSSQEVVSMIASQPTPTEAADFICQEAQKRWKEEEGTCDDMSVVIAYVAF